MSEIAENLKPVLLELPEEDRHSLAEFLYASIADEPDDTALDKELDRRLAEHESGRAPGVSAEAFFRRLRGRPA